MANDFVLKYLGRARAGKDDKAVRAKGKSYSSHVYKAQLKDWHELQGKIDKHLQMKLDPSDVGDSLETLGRRMQADVMRSRFRREKSVGKRSPEFRRWINEKADEYISQIATGVAIGPAVRSLKDMSEIIGEFEGTDPTMMLDAWRKAVPMKVFKDLR